VLRDVSFESHPDRLYAILVAANWQERDSQLLISLLKPDQGKIWIEEEEITALRSQSLQVRRKMGFLPRDAAS